MMMMDGDGVTNQATSAPMAESTDNDKDPTATASSSSGGVAALSSSSSADFDVALLPKSYGATEETMGVAQTNRKGSATDDFEVAADLVVASESAATFNLVSSVVAATSSSNNNNGNDGDAFRDKETITADVQEVREVELSNDDDATIVGNRRGIWDDHGREHCHHHHPNLPMGQQQRLSDAESSLGRSSVRPKQIGHANKWQAPMIGQLGATEAPVGTVVLESSNSPPLPLPTMVFPWAVTADPGPTTGLMPPATSILWQTRQAGSSRDSVWRMVWGAKIMPIAVRCTVILLVCVKRRWTGRRPLYRPRQILLRSQHCLPTLLPLVAPKMH